MSPDIVTEPLQKEIGVTKISLENATVLRRLHGDPVSIELYYDAPNPQFPPDYSVFVRYANGVTHRFTGFAWGYGGEGPRGLRQWALNNDVPLDGPTIAELQNARAQSDPVWEWKR